MGRKNKRNKKQNNRQDITHLFDIGNTKIVKANNNYNHDDQIAEILQLPDEILILICSFIHNYYDIIYLSYTCKQLNDISQDDIIWKGLFQLHWNKEIDALSTCKSLINPYIWKELYHNELDEYYNSSKLIDEEL